MRTLKNTILVGLGLFLAASAPAVEVLVSAAASLTDALKEIAITYEKGSGDKIVFNLGASSMLARQIEEGAPADIFFSADEAKMDALEKKGLIEKETRQSRLSNSLVIIVPATRSPAVKGPLDLRRDAIKRIALAEPKTVPAGIYAKEYLEKVKLWPSVESKIIPTENVRAALAAVEMGNVDAGIVYQTDAAMSTKVKITYQVPRSDAPNISYAVAVVKGAKQPEAARKFVHYLAGEDAGKVFEKFGFIVRK
jgi:molybdate transport system substrate-binding protein